MENNSGERVYTNWMSHWFWNLGGGRIVNGKVVIEY